MVKSKINKCMNKIRKIILTCIDLLFVKTEKGERKINKIIF